MFFNLLAQNSFTNISNRLQWIKFLFWARIDLYGAIYLSIAEEKDYETDMRRRNKFMYCCLPSVAENQKFNTEGKIINRTLFHYYSETMAVISNNHYFVYLTFNGTTCHIDCKIFFWQSLSVFKLISCYYIM